MYGKNMKKKGHMSDLEKEAKMNVVKSLRDQASDMMGEQLKKVTVASDSEQGLKAGLDKAKDLVAKKAELGDGRERMGANEESLHEDALEAPKDIDALEEASESPEEHEAELGENKILPPSDEEEKENMGLHEIEQKIKELEKLRAGKMGRLED